MNGAHTTSETGTKGRNASVKPMETSWKDTDSKGMGCDDVDWIDLRVAKMML